MRIIEPHHLRTVSYQPGRQKRKLPVIPVLLIVILLVGVALGVARYRMPLPQPQFTETKQQYSKKETNITWPTGSNAAVGAVGVGIIAVSDKEEKAAPTASVAKVVTALAVLDKKPLKLTEQGETITLTAEDEALYQKYIAQDGSVTAVAAGATLTEYQALQSLLLPSSNNMAETLTNWAFGSQQDYIQYANTYVERLGMTKTRIADASGFSAETVSTPSDLVRLGLEAIKNPVLAEIVNQKQADVPVAGTITNTNRLLGQTGINGIKTGNTDEAGGCYLASTTQQYENGKTATIVTAVMAAPTLTDAMNQTKPLIAQVKTGFGDTVIVTAGQQFGVLKTAWGAQTAVVAQKDVTVFGWPNNIPQTNVTSDIKTLGKGAAAGKVTVRFGEDTAVVDLKQDNGLAQPGFWWRLRRN